MNFINNVEMAGFVGSVNPGMKAFSLCVNDTKKSEEGYIVVESTWITVVHRRDFQGIEKGASVHVKGRLALRQYTAADGTSRSSYHIEAASVSPVGAC